MIVDGKPAELEIRLLDRVCRASVECLRELLHPQFREYGSSGEVWNLDDVLRRLPAEPFVDGDAEEFETVQLASDVVLLTYRIRGVDRSSLRSSVWVRSEDGQWHLRFHQATLIPSLG